jgi:hypothetical protein
LKIPEKAPDFKEIITKLRTPELAFNAKDLIRKVISNICIGMI